MQLLRIYFQGYVRYDRYLRGISTTDASNND